MPRRPPACPACDGLGVAILERGATPDGVPYRRLSNEPCLECKGVGHLARKAYTKTLSIGTSTPTMESLGRRVQITSSYRTFRVVPAPPERRKKLRARRRPRPSREDASAPADPPGQRRAQDNP